VDVGFVRKARETGCVQSRGGRAYGRLLRPMQTSDRRRVELGGEVGGAVLDVHQRYLAVLVAHGDDLACVCVKKVSGDGITRTEGRRVNHRDAM
jgi:hypothetical protein